MAEAIDQGLKILLANVADINADATGLERLYPPGSGTHQALARLMSACDEFWAAIGYEGDPTSGPGD